MERLPYRLGTDARPKIGVIVLEADETLEDDLRTVFPVAEAKLHISRIPSDQEVTVDTLAEMERTLPAAARLLPTEAHFSVIGYGCTSGTNVIGEARVAELVKSTAHTEAVTNPLTATFEALRALGVTRLGLVSPYIEEVAGPLKATFEKRGLIVPHAVTFGESSEARVARINEDSLRNAAYRIVEKGKVDAIFMSCTNLRTLSVIAPLEAEIGIPVLSSNQTLTWHLARLGGLAAAKPQFGRLWSKPLAL